MDWEINYSGVRCTSTDLTMADCATLEDLTGASWFSIDPCWRAAHLAKLTAYVVSKSTGRLYVELLDEIGKIPADVFVREHLVRKATQTLPTDG